MQSAHRPLALLVLTFGLGAAALGGCSGGDVDSPEKSQDPTETAGTSGTSGTSGKPASSGTSGKPSSSGTSGSSGSSGTSGSSGSSGTSGNVDTDAGADSGHDSGTTTGTGKNLGETCATNTDCKSGQCFVGGQGGYCSLLCTQANAATVCVPPVGNGCNNRGYCKK